MGAAARTRGVGADLSPDSLSRGNRRTVDPMKETGSPSVPDRPPRRSSVPPVVSIDPYEILSGRSPSVRTPGAGAGSQDIPPALLVSAQSDRPSPVHASSPLDMSKAVMSCIVEEAFWTIAPPLADMIIPGAGQAVAVVREGLHWAKVSQGLVEGRGAAIGLQVQGPLSFTLDLNARVYTPPDVAPFELGLGWKLVSEQALPVNVGIESGPAIETAGQPNTVAVRWFEAYAEARIGRAPGATTATANRPRSTGSRPAPTGLPPGVGLWTAVIGTGRRPKNAKAHRPSGAAVFLRAPIAHLLGGGTVLSANTVVGYVEWLSALDYERRRVRFDEATASVSEAWITAVVYIDQQTDFGVIVDLAGDEPPTIRYVTANVSLGPQL